MIFHVPPWQAMAYDDSLCFTWNFMACHGITLNVMEYRGIPCYNAMANHGILGGHYLSILFQHSLEKQGK